MAASPDRAIVPAAGLGTRLRPLTEAIPKEMLPLGRKPVLEHVVEELRSAGVVRILFVIAPGKEMIRAYFGDGGRLGVRCDYAIQGQMKGLGDAVLRGEEWSEGRPLVVAFGDCVIEPAGGEPLSRLVRTHEQEGSGATVLAQRVPRERTSRYGILAPAGEPRATDESSEPFPLVDIVEKPPPAEAPSDLAVAARWVLDSHIFAYLRAARPGPDGEVNLTEPVRAMIRDGASAWGVPLLPGEARRDIGGWDTYLTAAALAAARDPEHGETVREALRSEWDCR